LSIFINYLTKFVGIGKILRGVKTQPLDYTLPLIKGIHDLLLIPTKFMGYAQFLKFL
jgi:hypothetical protein